jgi:integrase
VTRYTHDGTRKPSGIRRHLYTLQAALRVIRPDWLIDKSVFPPELPRHPQLTPLQLKRVRLVLREPFLTIALVASLNFMRLSELLRLRREHVDFVTGTCLLHRAKAGPRTVPMGTVVATLLRQHLATHGHALVFPKRNGQPYSRFTVWEQWHAAMVAIGRPGFSFHDLRHHAAMTALEHGASFPELQALGGWARPDMVNRYATASNAHLRALQDLGARRATKLVARRRS